MRKILLLLATFAVFPVLAKPPPGADPNSEIYKWFDRQINMNSQGCCGVGDGHTLDADHFKNENGQMQILIKEHWFPVERWMFLQKALEDANPTGMPVAWWIENSPGEPYGIRIFCVALPWLT